MSSIEQIFDRIEKQVADEIAKQDIRCPACGYMWDCEQLAGHVTMWGEDPACNDECPNCDTMVWVKEEVTRTFDVTLNDPDEEKSCGTKSDAT